MESKNRPLFIIDEIVSYTRIRDQDSRVSTDMK